MRKESLEFLKTLLTTPSPSGFETENQRIWCDYARKIADEVYTDAYGNAVAVLNPGGGTKVVLDGHVDEIGLMIKHIDNDGFIYFQRIGGVDPALIRSKRVNIHTAKGIVRGVIGATAIHLRDRDEKPKVPKMHELYIDIGVDDGKAAKKIVAVGDPITFVEDFEMLSKHVAVARAFDNRIGTWAAIEAMRIAKSAKPKCALYACSSIQEETGLNGALMQAANIQPDVAIAVDVTHATDTPGLNVKQHGEVKLGEGPSISLGRENHPMVTDRLRKVAGTKKIKLQIETFSLTGGTNAYAYWNKNGGIPSAIVGIPNRYMHSTIETIDLRDLQSTADLLAAFVTSVKAKEKFKVKV
ncbi:MAG TPA: M42 family peptidase [Phycisphaerae bacterium]|nr:M42 family peptidase [Phycisphaerae bacterium]